MTIADFVQELWNSLIPKDTAPGNPHSVTMPDGLLHYGHAKGWLEDQDEVNCKNSLDKRTAARILHQFLKIELGRPDIPDITPAKTLQDLYTCRVCANHIAQIYVQGFMDAEEVELNGRTALIFNNLKPVSRKEAAEIIEKASCKKFYSRRPKV